MMFAALAAADTAGLPAAVLVHSAPGALFGSDFAHLMKLLPDLNALRTASGLPVVDRAWDAWRTMSVSFSTSPGDRQGQRSRLERTLRGLASTPCRILATFSGADIANLDVRTTPSWWGIFRTLRSSRE